ncbi:MAG: hypothetical protein HY587_06475 [Candidatus Omnitrophica bacterium]|nr:hypothetical protein [Candidatus Omnitrophota bacterium]
MFEFLKKLFGGTKKQVGPPPKKKDHIGDVTHYYGKVNAAVIKIKNGPLSVGDTIRIYGKHVDLTQKVTQMQIDHKPIQSAKSGQIVGLEVKTKLHEHDSVYRAAGS